MHCDPLRVGFVPFRNALSALGVGHVAVWVAAESPVALGPAAAITVVGAAEDMQRARTKWSWKPMLVYDVLDELRVPHKDGPCTRMRS